VTVVDEDEEMFVKTSLLIIGAGPYALSTAALAQERGIDTTIVGRPMGFWREHMPRVETNVRPQRGDPGARAQFKPAIIPSPCSLEAQSARLRRMTARKPHSAPEPNRAGSAAGTGAGGSKPRG